MLAIPAPTAARVLSQRRFPVVVIDAATLRAERGLGARLRAALQRTCVILLVDEHTRDTMDVALEINAAAMILRDDDDLANVKRVIEREIAGRRASDNAPTMTKDLIGESPATRRIREEIAALAPLEDGVLVTGEPGSGKTLVASLIHRLSDRRERPFVVVNCAGFVDAALDAELFGVPGHRAGQLERAEGGTLFLDDIGAMSLGVQAKLLAILRRRDGDEPYVSNVRIIASCADDLTPSLAAGSFRRDLFDRLAELTLEVPPLRERRSDVRLLWQHFAGDRFETTPRALMRLAGYDWPGNVRELQNVARHVLARLNGRMIGEELLPSSMRRHDPLELPMVQIPGMTLEELERSAITLTYRALGENAQATANALGISVRKVHYRLRRYREEGWLEGAIDRTEDIPPPAFSPQARRLLLAEDDDELRWTLTKILESEGFSVTAVSSGSAVLEHLGGAMLFERDFAPPDIIVSDVRMPGLSGLQVLEGIRQRGWKTPVVLITAFGDEDVRTRAMRLDATVLSKPLDVDHLQNVIARSRSAPN